MHSSVRDQVTTAEVRGEMAEAHKCYSKMAKVTKEKGGVASTNVGCTSWITLAITSVKVPRGTINWKIPPGESGMQPRDPCRPWREKLGSGHKPR